MLASFCIVQFSSVCQSCLTVCDPMNHSTPGLPVHHQLPLPTQTPMSIYIHIHIYTYIYTYVHIYIYVYICMYICVHMCIYIYIYTHTHTHTHTYICMYIYKIFGWIWNSEYFIIKNIKIFWHNYVIFWEHIFLKKYKKSPCLIEICKLIFR